MKKILCFGELLLRISPAASQVISEMPMVLYVGGAEANVATALSGWGLPVRYSTVLPDNFMSLHVIDYLKMKGIDTSGITFSGNRIGIYFLERGADLKGNMVYDRDGSSFSGLKPGDLDWDELLDGVGWFNFSAISPALNANLAAVCLEAVKAAGRRNIPVSIDLNYRSRLWKYGQEPAEVMRPMLEYCDVIMGNIWSANTLAGTKVDEYIHDHKSKQAYLDHAQQTSEELISRFPKCHTVANTFRFDTDDIAYYTTLYSGGELYDSPEFSCKGAVDRSGSGDCFMAGLIYGLYQGNKPQNTLNFASAAAFGKLQEFGDATGQDILRVSGNLSCEL